MPFVDDQDLNNLDDVPIPNIGTDLLDSADDSDEEPLGPGPVVPEVLRAEEAESAVGLDVTPGDEAPEEGNGVGDEKESDEEDNEDIPGAGMADEAPASPAPAKKRGRPSLAASRSATPKSAKNGASVGGRKRKAEVSADEPVAKRSGRGRATAAAASDAIKRASAKRPRAAPGTAKAAPKTTGGKRGRKPGSKAKKEVEEETSEEFEVEKIVDHAVDAKSKEHMYFVKWKGYDDSENTWEPKVNLEHAADLLKEFEATQKKEKKVPTAKKKPGSTKKSAAPARTPGRGRPGRPKRR